MASGTWAFGGRLIKHVPGTRVEIYSHEKAFWAMTASLCRLSAQEPLRDMPQRGGLIRGMRALESN